VINGPGSFSKWVTIGRMEISFDLFSRNFGFEFFFGFLSLPFFGYWMWEVAGE